MDTEQISRLINSVGFPIVMCMALFWSNYYMLSQQNLLLNEFKDAIYTNAKALQSREQKSDYAIAKLEVISNKIEDIEKCTH